MATADSGSHSLGDDFAAPQRLLILAGIFMILAGMLYGDLFAVFILHQNATHVGTALTHAAQYAIAGDASAVISQFAKIGGFLENRGTKVDAHAHLVAFGYLALLLAILQPRIRLSGAVRLLLAKVFVGGAILLPVSVFFIHYVGRAMSPLRSIGWASVFADFGGAVTLIATIGYLVGFLHGLSRQGRASRIGPILGAENKRSPLLFRGGLLLVLLGFAYGAIYAAHDLYRQEASDHAILSAMTSAASARDSVVVDHSLTDYGNLQGDKAVKIAAHAHIIEFGVLAMILSALEGFVGLSGLWKRRWSWVLLSGSLLLPLCVFLEIRFGLLAGVLADFGGLLVILALAAFGVGVTRHKIAATATTLEWSKPAIVLLTASLSLATFGMCYGLWYAIFTEHQTLEALGTSLSDSFIAAAQHNPLAASEALDRYSRMKFVYERQVDVHSHWIGIAMVFFVLGLCLPTTEGQERVKILAAYGATAGSILFPAGVLYQTVHNGSSAQVLTIAGAALLLASLACFAIFAIRQAA